MNASRSGGARHPWGSPTRLLRRWAEIGRLIRYGETRSAVVRPRAE